ncbi:hypothetical protein P1X14_06925 [Sphingomonas sp. AOB5]|uniref:hypothetical protein n=1 Tax=Sphingomonas sp. AOB5 TaxID=3034017 RepID=UPI0023FA3572|nr:hypothetical protein [Sphingomonas sp. AOB5]MDF7774971.1 hypothetical protein [Sphingomonas sp. AOB5]
MTSPTPSRTPMAGGFLIASGIFIGVIGGAFANQVTIGFLAGLAGGLVAATALWLIDRQR